MMHDDKVDLNADDIEKAGKGIDNAATVLSAIAMLIAGGVGLYKVLKGDSDGD